MTEYTSGDLVTFSLNQQPIEFENAFNSLMVDRLAVAINDKKTEMAQTIFKDQEEDEDNGQDA